MHTLGRSVAISLGGLVFFSSLIHHTNGASLEEDPSESIWEKSFSLRSAVGYKDNVLLGRKNEEQSAFLGAGLDAMVFSLPLNGHHFSLFFSGDYVRYLDADSVDAEAFAFAQAEYLKDLGDSWRLGVGQTYIYQDQVIDASATEQILTTQQIRGHNISLGPVVEKDIAKRYRLELEVPVERQFFDDPLDDYWEVGPELTLVQKVSRRTELRYSYEYRHKYYDTRTARTGGGFTIPDSDLEYGRHAIGIRLRHYLDEKRRWRSVSRISYARNEDNGGGFFDYDRYHFSQQVRYRNKRWEVTADLKLSAYHFDKQRDDDGRDARRKLSLRPKIRGEFNMKHGLLCYLEYEYEQSFSNQDFDEYSANTVAMGVEWAY